jgi:sec-independent protein translocase protein TatB
MVVLFIVVLVVFGPQKLPELARGLGKLMAEFRKASTDFRTAFEEEMRDIERQALQAERRKAAEAAAASSAQPEALPSESTLTSEAVTDATWPTPAPTASPEVPTTGSEAGGPADSSAGPTVTPVAEAVARSAKSAESAETVKPELLPAEPHENSISDSQKAS